MDPFQILIPAAHFHSAGNYDAILVLAHPSPSNRLSKRWYSQLPVEAMVIRQRLDISCRYHPKLRQWHKKFPSSFQKDPLPFPKLLDEMPR